MKPLVPEDVGLRQRAPRACTYLYRAGAAHVRAFVNHTSPEREAKALFGDDKVTPLLLRATSPVATIGSTAWAGALARQSIDDAVADITSISAAAALIQRGQRLTFDGYASIRVPGHFVDPSDAGSWVGEGQPVRVRAQRFSAGVTLQPRKLMVITSYTNEMARGSNIEEWSQALISEAMALKLDQTLFGSQADDTVTPVGLLNGVSALTPTAGGGAAALAADFKQLISALVAAGAGRDPVLVCNPVQAGPLRMPTSPSYGLPVLQSTGIAVGTVIMVEGSSFVSAFSPTVEFRAGDEMSIHMEDTAPADPIMGGTPVRSMFQIDSIGVAATLTAAYGLRGATVSGQHNIAYLTGATW